MAHDHFKQVTINGVDPSGELAHFATEIGLTAVAPERYSVVFLVDLFRLAMSPNGLGQSLRVMDEIRHLEGQRADSMTKPATPFLRKPLAGLWHKHYWQEGLHSFAINMQRALHKYGIPALEVRVRPADEEPEIMTEETLREVIDDAVVGNFNRRSADNQMTGEWIIYAKEGGQNFYLSLERHADRDDKTFHRIKRFCVYEFPFLCTLLEITLG